MLDCKLIEGRDDQGFISRTYCLDMVVAQQLFAE